MSRVTTTLTLALLVVGGALFAISMSSSGIPTHAPHNSSPSPTAPIFDVDDGEEIPDCLECLPTVATVAASIPVAIHLPTSSATVRPVGVNQDGSMEIPDNPKEVGWYKLTGVRPGDAGTAVIAGHVDSRTQGRGAFFELSTLTVGDQIVLETPDGNQSWTVSALAVYPRPQLPIADIFTLSGAPRLALVTCGGEFDRVAGSYRDNVVVYAYPTVSAN